MSNPTCPQCDCVAGCQAYHVACPNLAAIAQPEQPAWLLTTTQNLAKSIAKRCYPNVPQFQVLNDLAGVISQIDNMTIGMERKTIAQPEQTAEPVAWMTEDGRVASNTTKQTAMPSSIKLVFTIPLYLSCTIAQPKDKP